MDEDAGFDAQYGDEVDRDSNLEGEEEDLWMRDDGDEDNVFDKNEEGSEVSEFMQEMEDDEFEKHGLKMPADLEGEGSSEEEYGDERFDEYDSEDIDPAGANNKRKVKQDADRDGGESVLDDVFDQARENQEMDIMESLKQKVDEDQHKGFVNDDMLKKIESIENEMMNPKEWQLTGEAKAADRDQNTLLNVHLDFNTATKLPPTITKEVTNAIEGLIKQRVLDELFDDPILRDASTKKKLKDRPEMDFTKSKKGLGDLYAEDLTKKLASLQPEAFLEQELAGPDAPLKREIEDISQDLFQNLDTLSNFHFVPKAPKVESSI